MKDFLKLLIRHRLKTTFTCLFLLYNLVGFLLVPWLTRGLIPAYISDGYLNGQVSIEKASVNPYTFTMTVEDVSLTDEKANSVATVESATFNFDPLKSLFSWRFSFSDIQVLAASLDGTLLEDGSVSLAYLLKESETEDTSALTLPPVDVENFQVSETQLTVTDDWMGDGFKEEIGDIRVSAQNFSTAPESENRIKLSAQTGNGAQANWDGTVQFNPLSSRGNLKLDGFRSDAYAPYYRQLFDAELSTEALSLSLDFVFAPADEEPQIAIFNTYLEQSNVSLSEPEGGQTLIEAQRIAMDGIAVDFITGKASMGQLTVEGERLFAAREENEEINLIQHLLPTGLQESLLSDTKTPAEAQQSSTPDIAALEDAPKDILYAIQKAIIQLQSIIELAWQFEMDRVEINNQEIELVDRSLSTPALLVIESFDLLVTELSNREDEDAQVALSLNIRGGGRVEVSGTVTPVPTTMRLEFSVRDIDLSVVSPYLKTFNDTELESGIFSTEGTLFVDFGPFIENNELPELEISGGLGIKNFAFNHEQGETRQRILSWESMEAVDYAATTQPSHQLKLGAVQVTGPYAYVEVLSDGSLSLQKLIPESAPPDLQTTEPETEVSDAPPLYLQEIQLPVSLEIATVSIEEGTFEVRDQFYGEGFHAKWESLSARIDNLTTQDDTPISIDAKGRQANGSVFNAKIDLHNPLLIDREIVADFQTEVLASPFTPYAERVVGFPITEGHILVDTRFELSKDAVNARVKIDMNQFELGDKADVEDVMIKLPVKLGISLMKDRNGKIDLPEVKVDGSLTDPEFNVGEIIGGVFVRMITNAVTKPFSFLSSAFGSDDSEDLEQLIFEPGSPELPLEQTEKLKILADALFNRPQLALSIIGYADPEAEAQTVREKRLEADLAKFFGTPQSDALKILYYERMPEAFAAYQAENTPVVETEISSAETMAPEEQSEAPVEISEEPQSTESPKKKSWGLFSFIGDIFGSESEAETNVAENTTEVEIPKTPDSPEEMPEVAEVTKNPEKLLPAQEKHIALTDPTFLFPEAGVMKTALLEQIEISATYWTDLAQTRSEVVQQALLSLKELPEARLVIANPQSDESTEPFVGVRFDLK
ncbi:MAG: DUF748 domain-containing protein [Opitutales bacterium]